MLSQPQPGVPGQVLLGVLVTVAAFYDIRFRRIPNWLVLCGCVAGFWWNFAASGGAGLGRAAAGLGLGFMLYLPLYLIRARGAGDVKLFAAAGSVTGPGGCLWLFVTTAVAGGVIAVTILLVQGRLRRTLFNVGWILRDLSRLRAPWKSNPELDVTTGKGMRLPHGAIMAAGTAVFLSLGLL